MLVTYNGPAVPARTTTDVDLSVVEVYPYVPYIQFLLPGTISLSIFVSAMIGGGIIFIDDKARGLHEGYLVTPISKFELIMGFTLAGAAKAIIAGVVLITVGSIIAGIPDPLDPIRIAKMFVLVVATSMALISMMFMIMVRVSDPLVPRAIFGMLNTVLYFPSGAVYPTASFPGWMKAIAVVDPFTYAVDGFKELVLKNTSLAAINYDLAFLAGFTVLTLGLATLLFRRTL
jgi:ABC-2 type transport system permease protein